MKRFLLPLLFLISLSIAVRPVSRNDDLKNNKPDVRIQNPLNENEPRDGTKEEIQQIEEIKNQTEKDDRFQDADSNNVNDQREDDLLKIKQLKTKFKDLFRKFTAPKKEESKKKPDRVKKDNHR
ncbi:MAG: hypothetical protein ABIL70_03980 [candidate division WOR-3 bacterium]